MQREVFWISFEQFIFLKSAENYINPQPKETNICTHLGIF